MTLLSRFRWWRRLRGGEWVRKKGVWHQTVTDIPFKEAYVMPTPDEMTEGFDDDQKRRWNQMWDKLTPEERHVIRSQYAMIWD